MNPSLNIVPFSQPSYWIWSAEGCTQRRQDRSPSAYEVRRFRNSFCLPQNVSSVRLFISADTRYLLWLDGQQIGHGPVGGDIRHQFYDTYDLQLQDNAEAYHTLAILVVDYSPVQCNPPQTGAPSAWMTRHGGMALELYAIYPDATAEPLLLSDESWRVQVEHARHFQSGKADWFDSYAGLYEHFHAAADNAPNWYAPAYDDSHWEHANHLYPTERYSQITDPQSPYGLLPREVPFQEAVSAITPIAIFLPGGTDAPFAWYDLLSTGKPLTLPSYSEHTVILELEREWTGTPRIVFDGGSASIIHIGYAEALRIERNTTDAVVFGLAEDTADVALGFDENSTGWTFDHRGNFVGCEDIVHPDGRNWQWSPHHWRTAKFLQLHIRTEQEPLQLKGFTFTALAHPLHVPEPFQCSDPRWERLQETNLHTLRLSMQETFIDCPYYEQLQYIGDSALNCATAMLAAGTYPISRQLLRHFDWSRTPEGWAQSRYPSRNEQVIPSQALDWIGAIHAYALQSGDLPTVREVWRGAREVIETYSNTCNANGLPENLPYWNWVDWAPGWKRGVPPGGDCGPVLPHAAKLGVALLQAIAIAEWLGDGESARKLGAQREQLSQAVWKNFWNGRFFADSALHPQQGSRLGNALAVLAGFLPTEHRQEMGALLSGSTLTSCSFFGHYFVRQALWELGACDLERELAPWWHMQDLGLTTWAEDTAFWRSLCHGWSANPAIDIFTRVLGVQPLCPGFTQTRIKPALELFASARGSVVTPHGAIHVRWDRSLGELTLVIPAGIRVELHLPTANTTLLDGGKHTIAFQILTEEQVSS